MLASTGRRSLRLIASFEAFKVAIVLIAGFGVLSSLGRDAERLAEQLVLRMRLNPAHRYPHIFINAIAGFTRTRLWLLTASRRLRTAAALPD